MTIHVRLILVWRAAMIIWALLLLTTTAHVIPSIELDHPWCIHAVPSFAAGVLLWLAYEKLRTPSDPTEDNDEV